MNALVYVETRPYPDLKQNILGQIKFLPDWPLYIFCSPHNQHLFGDIAARYFHCVVRSLPEYNRLLTSARFWHTIQADKCLIFQHDTGILKPWDATFEQYDYIGAPWKFQAHGGNGGLSWRNVNVMRQIIAENHYTGNPYEDVWFCNIMFQQNMNLAPREVCESFAVETIFRLGTFGFHAIENWLSKEQCNLIRNQYLKA